MPPLTPLTRKEIRLRMSKAKDYLSQVKKKAKAVQEQKELIQRLRDSLDLAGVQYDKDRVQSSPDTDKFGKIFAEIEEQEKVLEEKRTAFMEFRVLVIYQIRKIPNAQFREVLNRVYIDFLNIKQCSEEMNYSYIYVRELHMKALNAFERMYPQLLS